MNNDFLKNPMQQYIDTLQKVKRSLNTDIMSHLSSDLKCLREPSNIMSHLSSDFKCLTEESNLSKLITSPYQKWKGIDDFTSSLYQQRNREIANFLTQLSQPKTLNDKLLLDARASSLLKSSRIEALTIDSLSRLKTQDIGKLIPLHNDARISVFENFQKLSDTYLDLTGLREKLDPDFDGILVSIPYEQLALEMLEIVNLLESITEENENNELEEEKNSIRNEISREVGSLQQLLIDMGENDLLDMWQGAIFALESKKENPDYARHFSCSLRELLTHLLHRLAPNEEVKKWTDNPKHFHKNKPTRKARLLFICQGLNKFPEFHDKFPKWIEENIHTIMAMIDLLHNGAHKPTNPLKHRLILALKTTTEATVRLLITTWRLR